MDSQKRLQSERVKEKIREYEQDHAGLLNTVKALRERYIPTVAKMSGSRAE